MADIPPLLVSGTRSERKCRLHVKVSEFNFECQSQLPQTQRHDFPVDVHTLLLLSELISACFPMRNRKPRRPS